MSTSNAVDEYEAVLDSRLADIAREREELKDKFTEQLRSVQEKVEIAKHAKQQKMELICNRWMLGEKEGWKKQTFQTWHWYTTTELKLKRNAKNIEKAIYAWAEGDKKALIDASYRGWKTAAQTWKLERESRELMEVKAAHHKEVMQEIQDMADARVRAGEETIDRKKAAFHNQVTMVVARWEGDDKSTLQGMIFKALSKNRRQRKMKRAHSKGTQAKLMNLWNEQDAFLLKSHWCFWAEEHLHAKGVKEEKRAGEDQAYKLNQARIQTEKDAKEEKRRAKEALRNSIDLAVKKWEMGTEQGLRAEVWTCWSNTAIKNARMKRWRADITSVTTTWIKGDNVGCEHLTFHKWAHYVHAVIQDRKQQAALSRQRKEQDEALKERLNGFDVDLNAHKTKAEIAKARAKALIDNCCAEWTRGETKGLMYAVLTNWDKTVKAIIATRIRRNKVKSAVLRAVTNDDTAATKLAWLGWYYTFNEKRRGAKEHQQMEAQKSAWEKRSDELAMKHCSEKRRMAHAHAEHVLRCWGMGERLGLMNSTYLAWQRFYMHNKRKRRAKAHVYKCFCMANDGDDLGTKRCVSKLWQELVVYHLRGKMNAARGKALRAETVVMMQGKDSKALSVMVFTLWKDECLKKHFEISVRSYLRQDRPRYVNEFLGRSKMQGIALQAAVFTDWWYVFLKMQTEKACFKREESLEFETNVLRDKLERLKGAIEQNELLHDHMKSAKEKFEHLAMNVEKETQLKAEMVAELNEAMAELNHSGLQA